MTRCRRRASTVTATAAAAAVADTATAADTTGPTARVGRVVVYLFFCVVFFFDVPFSRVVADDRHRITVHDVPPSSDSSSSNSDALAVLPRDPGRRVVRGVDVLGRHRRPARGDVRHG